MLIGFSFPLHCFQWVMAAMLAMQPVAAWKATYPETATAICLTAEKHPIYQADPDANAALLLAISFHESHWKPNVRATPSLCEMQISPIFIQPHPSLIECFQTGSDLLKSSINRFGDIRAYTHGLPYPRHDTAGSVRLYTAQQIQKRFANVAY